MSHRIHHIALSLLPALLVACQPSAEPPAPIERCESVEAAPVAVAARPPAELQPAVAPLAKPEPAPSARSVAPRAEAPKASAPSPELAVKRLVLATGVDKGSRSPMGTAERFQKSEYDRIYAFVELSNPGPETDIIVSFQPPGDAPSRGRVELSVGRSPRWRTWAFSRGVVEEGTWDAVVTTADGRELARTTFEISG